jgi:hypothetical protein
VTRGCAICGRQPARSGELPSGQPLCDECTDHWQDVRVYAFTRSGVVHLHEWCLNIETTRAIRKNNQQTSRRNPSTEPRELRFGQVPNHRVCKVCWSCASAPIDRAVEA